MTVKTDINSPIATAVDVENAKIAARAEGRRARSGDKTFGDRAAFDEGFAKGTAEAEAALIPRAADLTAREATLAAREAAVAGAVAAALIEERARWRDVLTAPEAKGREAALLELLGSTDMVAAGLLKIAATLPARSSLDMLMAKHGATGIETGGEPPTDDRSRRAAELATAGRAVAASRYGTRPAFDRRSLVSREV